MPGPALPAPITDYMIGKITIDGPDARWTEQHAFNNSVAESKTRLGVIVEARRRLLAAKFKITDAVISQVSVLFDSYPVWPADGGPVQSTTDTAGPPVEIAPCNDSTVGMLVRFQAEVGRKELRIVTALRDTYITDNWFTFATAYSNNYTAGAYIGGTYPPTYTAPPGDTPVHLIHNYLSIVRDKTILVSPVPSVDGQWYPFNFLSYSIEAVKHRQRGVVTRIPRGRATSWS